MRSTFIRPIGKDVSDSSEIGDVRKLDPSADKVPVKPEQRKSSTTLLLLSSSDAEAAAANVDAVRMAFARSLAESAQWKARGGKSGSKFCKTSGKTFI